MTSLGRVRALGSGALHNTVHIVNDQGRAKCDPHGTYVDLVIVPASAPTCKRCIHLRDRFKRTDRITDCLIEIPDAPRYGDQQMTQAELASKLSNYYVPGRHGYLLGSRFVPKEMAQTMSRAAIANLLLEEERKGQWPEPTETLRITLEIDVAVTYGQEFSNLCRAVEGAIGKKGWSVLSLGGYGEDIVITRAARLDTQKIFREEESDESAAQ